MNAPQASAALPALTLLLPAIASLEGQGERAPSLARVFARGDRRPCEAGDEVQLQRHFDLLPRGLPVAALTRQFDCGDAAGQTWLRADPAHVRADLGAGRLMACGDLGFEPGEVVELMQPLKPLFGDDGGLLSAGADSRWYLALPREARVPEFSPPSRVLGDDIFAHLPQGDAGRRWRRLLSEAQVILHNHPVNAARIARGRLPVNTVWFWGGGALPDHVRSPHARVASDDLLLASLARAAAVTHLELPSRLGPDEAAGALIDLRRIRDAGALERDWIAPALQALRSGQVSMLQLDAADGWQVDYRRGHGWRLWRRIRADLA